MRWMNVLYGVWLFVSIAGSAPAIADEIEGRHGATPSTLEGTWEIGEVLQVYEKRPGESVPLDLSGPEDLYTKLERFTDAQGLTATLRVPLAELQATRFRFRHDSFDVMRHNEVLTTRDYNIARPASIYVGMQQFFYSVDQDRQVFRLLPLGHKRVDESIEGTIHDSDITVLRVSTQDDLLELRRNIPHAMHHLELRRVPGPNHRPKRSLRHPVLRVPRPEDDRPEEKQIPDANIAGIWTADGLRLSLETVESPIYPQGIATFATGRGVLALPYIYAADGDSGAIFLPAGSQNEAIFVRMKIKISSDAETLQVELVPHVRRWLKKIMPVAGQGTVTLSLSKAVK